MTELVEYQNIEMEDLRVQLKELEEMVQKLSEQRDEQLFLIKEFDARLQLAVGAIVGDIHQWQIKIEHEKLRQKQDVLLQLGKCVMLQGFFI